MDTKKILGTIIFVILGTIFFAVLYKATEDTIVNEQPKALMDAVFPALVIIILISVTLWLTF